MSNPTALIAGLSTILFACSALLVSAQPSEPDSFKEIGNAQSSDYPLELTNDQDIGNDLDAVARLHEINGNYTLAIDNYLNFVLEVQEQQGSYSAALIESMIVSPPPPIFVKEDKVV